MTSASGTTTQVSDKVVMYGAEWCVDCRNAKAVLDQEQEPYDYVDLMADETAAERAEAISGQKHIPVVVFPDGVYYVEPTKQEMALKIRALRAEAGLASDETVEATETA